MLESQWKVKERLDITQFQRGEMKTRYSCPKGEISGVPVKWQDMETPTQEWDPLTTRWGWRNRNDRQNKEESDRRDWEEERSDGTVVNPPTQYWDPAEYIKWNGGRFGSKETNWHLFSFVVITWTLFLITSKGQVKHLFINIMYHHPKITVLTNQCVLSRCV